MTGLPLLLDIIGRTIRNWTPELTCRYAVPFLILCLNMRYTKQKQLSQRVLKVIFDTILETTQGRPAYAYEFLQSLVRNMAGRSTDQQMVFLTFLTNKITALHPCISTVQLVSTIARGFACFGSSKMDNLDEKLQTLAPIYRLVKSTTDDLEKAFPVLDVLENNAVVRAGSYRVVILLSKAKNALE